MRRVVEEGIAIASLTPIQIEQIIKSEFLGDELDKVLLGMKLCLGTARENESFKQHLFKKFRMPPSKASLKMREAKRAYMQFLKDLKEGKFNDDNKEGDKEEVIKGYQ